MVMATSRVSSIFKFLLQFACLDASTLTNDGRFDSNELLRDEHELIKFNFVFFYAVTDKG